MTTSDPERMARAVAGNVRALRQDRGWSLELLATRSGVSKGMLVAVEQGRSNPSITTLCRIADAFGTTLGPLVEFEPAADVHVVRAADALTIWQGATGGTAVLRIAVDGDPPAELWEWELPPGVSHPSSSDQPGQTELISVLAGTLTLQHDGILHELGVGDTLGYPADRPHAYANTGEQACRFTMVVLLAPRRR